MKPTRSFIDINPANFDLHVRQSKIPVLVAVFRKYDNAQTTILIPTAASSLLHQDRIAFGCMTLDRYPELSSLIGITCTPALLLFQGGEITYQFLGQWSHKEIFEIFTRLGLNDDSLSTQEI
jgi:thioredoxin-like negative regulator of GroEL